MRYALLLTLLVALLPTIAAADRDPKCKDSSLLDQPETVDATGTSTVGMCSPSHGSTGVPYPDAPGGPLMTCVFLIAGEVASTHENVGPEQMVVHTDPALRFGHAVDLVCTNAEGEGRLAVVVTAIFPADAPGRPYVLPGP